jgi:cytochrome b involved in lipid metabolism
MSTSARNRTPAPARRTLAAAAVAVAVIGGGMLVAPAAHASTPAFASSQVSTMVTAKAYSKSTVARHHTASDCWSIVDHRVYNLTKWVAKHPGGRKRIVRMCGKDASAAFHSRHSTTGRAGKALKRYRIGTLK